MSRPTYHARSALHVCRTLLHYLQQYCPHRLRRSRSSHIRFLSWMVYPIPNGDCRTRLASATRSHLLHSTIGLIRRLHLLVITRTDRYPFWLASDLDVLLDALGGSGLPSVGLQS